MILQIIFAKAIMDTAVCCAAFQAGDWRNGMLFMGFAIADVATAFLSRPT